MIMFLRTCEEHIDCIIVYDGYNCPVCAELDELKGEISGYKEEVEDWQFKVERLEEELLDLQENN